MRLKRVKIERFRNFVEPQVIEIEDDVTALVGKNESGKTSILEALHRIKPANLRDSRFDLVTEYPRWRLSGDRKTDPALEYSARPVVAWFELEDRDREALDGALPAPLPTAALLKAAKTYSGRGLITLECPTDAILAAALADAGVDDEDMKTLEAAIDIEAVKAAAKELTKELTAQEETARAKAVRSVPGSLDRYSYLNGELEDEAVNALMALVPQFFYFSDWDLLPGEHDLDELAEKIEAGTGLDGEDESVAALLSYANTTPGDFLGDDYNARKAELQASALGLTRKVFDYWRQNRDLEVEFDTELEEIGTVPGTNQPILHRILKILLRDLRHGGISTNFETRSAGFRWFFSFLAAFSRYQESEDPIIVLLDEPGTSLHGEAQKDFLRFIFEELGSSKQVLYTTHSQYLVDPTRYERLRAVEDRSTRENPDLGVAVTPVAVSADRDTLLPIQAALGYSISQHLFLGAGRHLTVEGGSDVIYLTRLSEFLESQGRVGLDPRLSAIPLGSASNTPAFVALFAKHMEVSVLLDGDRQGKDAQRVYAQAANGLLTEGEIVVVADVSGVPVAKPDIEDLFHPEDYLSLYNWAYGKAHALGDLPASDKRILRRIEDLDGVVDHAPPAYALTEHREEFFASVKPETLDRFEELFKLLNASIPSGD